MIIFAEIMTYLLKFEQTYYRNFYNSKTNLISHCCNLKHIFIQTFCKCSTNKLRLICIGLFSSVQILKIEVRILHIIIY